MQINPFDRLDHLELRLREMMTDDDNMTIIVIAVTKADESVLHREHANVRAPVVNRSIETVERRPFGQEICKIHPTTIMDDPK